MFEAAALRVARSNRLYQYAALACSLEGKMTHAMIRHDAIKQLFAEMRRSFDSNGPVRIAVDALIPDRLGEAAASTAAAADSGDRLSAG
jgi:hypothetical protein